MLSELVKRGDLEIVYKTEETIKLLPYEDYFEECFEDVLSLKKHSRHIVERYGDEQEGA